MMANLKITRLILNSTLSSEDARAKIIERWLDEDMPHLKCFSPYSITVFKFLLLFILRSKTELKVSESKSKQRRKKGKNRDRLF